MNVAFFDESGHSSATEHFSMAACLGRWDDWREFNSRWNDALTTHKTPYLHMREFAHSIGPFKDWSETQRRRLMSACLDSIEGLELVAVGSAMRVSDFRRLSAHEQAEFVDPLFCCFQDCLYGIGLHGYLDFPGMKTDVVYSQQDEFGPMLRKLYRVEKNIRREGSLLGELHFSDMRSSPGLQFADLVAYELRHYYQQRNSGRPIRYPFKRICDHQLRQKLGMFLFVPGWKLEFQAKGIWLEAQEVIWSDWERWESMILQMAPEPTNARARIPQMARDRDANRQQLQRLRRDRGRLRELVARGRSKKR